MLPFKPDLFLIDGAVKGSLMQVQDAIRMGANVHINNDQPLRAAAEDGHDHVVLYLLNMGADVHALDDSALRRAVSFNHVAVVKVLLENGANPNANTFEAIIHAASSGKIEILTELLKHGGSPTASKNLPLGRAAYSGSFEIVKALMENGADPFLAYENPLGLARERNHTKIVDYLEKEIAARRAEFLEHLKTQKPLKVFLNKLYKNTAETAFIRAVRMDCLEETVNMLVKNGERLEFADLFAAKDHMGHHLAFLAVTKHKLGLLFKPELWGADVRRMGEALNALTDREQAAGGFDSNDLSAVISAYKHQQLKQKKNQIKPRF